MRGENAVCGIGTLYNISNSTTLKKQRQLKPFYGNYNQETFKEAKKLTTTTRVLTEHW